MVRIHQCQWNIGGVGSSSVGARVGHVHFILFVSISFVLGTQRKRVFSGIWALKFEGRLSTKILSMGPKYQSFHFGSFGVARFTECNGHSKNIPKQISNILSYEITQK